MYVFDLMGSKWLSICIYPKYFVFLWESQRFLSNISLSMFVDKIPNPEFQSNLAHS